jgi:dihydromonapterin reductase/dihydrofolate reductase
MGELQPHEEVALVTGGYKKIGLEISKILIEMGYEVFATYRSDRETAITNSRRFGFEVIRADMSDEEDVQSLFSEIRSRGYVVSILINNVSSFHRGPLIGMDPVKFREAFQSIIFSCFYAVNEAVPDMRSIGRGSIINIGMAGTSEIKGYIDVAAHASAKNALSVITMSLARELENDSISVDLIGPGMVDDPERDEEWRKMMRSISPSSRLVPGKDIANAVREFLHDPKMGGRIIDII